MTHEGLTLVRNPRFRVWSPAAQPEGFVDQIDWVFGVEPQAQVKAIGAGDADLAFDAAASGQLEELFVRQAAQVHSSPEALTFFAVLDTEAPPFDNVRARQAMNLAVDRGRVVEIFGGDRAALPTCQQLPPNFPGYEPYCPYTMGSGPDGNGVWAAPDFEKAQRLVRRSGTEGIRVVVEVSPYLADFAQVSLLGDYIVELLQELGYRGIVRDTTLKDFYDPDNDSEMAVDGWGSDYPAASNFITNRFPCDTQETWTPSAGLCDEQIDALIDRATQTQLDDPAASGALWAEVDRAIVDQAPYVWLVNTIAVEFVSERVGNYQHNSQWGVLLNQLWVH